MQLHIALPMNCILQSASAAFIYTCMALHQAESIFQVKI